MHGAHGGRWGDDEAGLVVPGRGPPRGSLLWAFAQPRCAPQADPAVSHSPRQRGPVRRSRYDPRLLRNNPNARGVSGVRWVCAPPASDARRPLLRSRERGRRERRAGQRPRARSGERGQDRRARSPRRCDGRDGILGRGAVRVRGRVEPRPRGGEGGAASSEKSRGTRGPRRCLCGPIRPRGGHRSPR